MGAGANLTVAANRAAVLEYQGASDPRWSEPQMLVWSDMVQMVLPLPAGQTRPLPGQRLASSQEVQEYFLVASHQRILADGVDTEPQIFVVNALYRQPCQDPLYPKSLSVSPLPSELRITKEEMDVLGPWLGLRHREDVCDEGENILDLNFGDGTDRRYQTKYNWADFLSVTDLYAHLKVFEMVRDGSAQNPRNWPTDFDERRLKILIDQTDTRSKELYDQLPHKPTTREKCIDSLIFGGGLVATSAAAGGAWLLFKKYMAKRLLVAGGAALVDGPVPVGDVAGAGILLFSVGDFVWNYDEIVDEFEN